MRGKSKAVPKRHRVALALQGGGSHGAFTWGVLDRLLEEPGLEIVGITGTSAGAMNAVALADGLLKGGPDAARKGLREFWTTIGAMPGFGTLLGSIPGEVLATLQLETTPPFLLWEALSRHLSPYELNPTGANPLRAPLAELIDFERLRAQEKIQVMVCATNVRTAARRVFTNKELTLEAVLASACLPQLFPAVEIDGEPYWDGGYTGNPAIAPLLHKLPREKLDLMFVRVDPIARNAAPRTNREIQDRITEIGFNSSLRLELSMLAMVVYLVEQGAIDRERFGRFRFHGIEASATMEKLAHSSKMNNAPALLEYLFGLGRQAADSWWARHGQAIGRRSSVDLKALLPPAFWS